MKGFLLLLITLIVGSAQAQNWQLAWSDEFDGTTLNLDNWTPVNAGTGFGNRELQYYSSRPDNLLVANGLLTITARLEAYQVGTASWKYTSAKISSSGKKDFTYGKIEARIKLPHGAGTWPAFWTLGYGSWPSCGENDILEYVGSKPDEFQSNVHTKDYNGSNGKNFHMVKPFPNVADTFHVFSIEWDSMRIKYFVDGNQYWTFSSLSVTPINYPFNNPNYLILNLAIGGTMGGVVDDGIFPQQLVIDYVRVYKNVASVNKEVSNNQPLLQTEFSDKLSIDFSETNLASNRVTLLDLTGKVLLDETTEERKLNVDTHFLNKGIYLVRLKTGNKIISQKIRKI
ncbi:MAG TPA: family 16 glycosylhydrolase [Bacteroidales bacterium]|nr:family 16 glycosylhydrolase [Bacteroidales bacterium]